MQEPPPAQQLTTSTIAHCSRLVGRSSYSIAKQALAPHIEKHNKIWQTRGCATHIVEFHDMKASFLKIFEKTCPRLCESLM